MRTWDRGLADFDVAKQSAAYERAKLHPQFGDARNSFLAGANWARKFMRQQIKRKEPK